MSDETTDAQARIGEDTRAHRRNRLPVGRAAQRACTVLARDPRAQALGALGALRPQARGGDLHERRCLQQGPLYGDDLREIYEAILHVAKEMRG